ncbi:unnamed protein product [Closterium sp. NIES-54]
MKGWMGRAVEFLDAAGEEGADTIIEGLMAYVDGVGSFGMPLAKAHRAKVKEGKMDMEMWWAWNGTDNVALATLARRVLAQPVSASPCERGWSTWDSVHTARRNRLGSEKCRDLVYVAHNWNVVRKWSRDSVAGRAIVSGNIPEAPIPEGYNAPEEGEDEKEGEDEADRKVFADEYQ